MTQKTLTEVVRISTFKYLLPHKFCYQCQEGVPWDIGRQHFLGLKKLKFSGKGHLMYCVQMCSSTHHSLFFFGVNLIHTKKNSGSGF